MIENIVLKLSLKVTLIFFSDTSMPVIFAPNLLSGSLKSPPPHPISKIFNPFSGFSIFSYILKRINRTYEDIYLLVEDIDKLSLEEKRELTIPLIKELI